MIEHTENSTSIIVAVIGNYPNLQTVSALADKNMREAFRLTHRQTITAPQTPPVTRAPVVKPTVAASPRRSTTAAPQRTSQRAGVTPTRITKAPPAERTTATASRRPAAHPRSPIDAIPSRHPAQKDKARTAPRRDEHSKRHADREPDTVARILATHPHSRDRPHTTSPRRGTDIVARIIATHPLKRATASQRTAARPESRPRGSGTQAHRPKRG